MLTGMEPGLGEWSGTPSHIWGQRRRRFKFWRPDSVRSEAVAERLERPLTASWGCGHHWSTDEQGRAVQPATVIAVRQFPGWWDAAPRRHRRPTLQAAGSPRRRG